MDEEYEKIKQMLIDTRIFLSCICGNILNGNCIKDLSADNRVYSAQIMLDSYNAIEKYNKQFKPID